MSIKKRFEKWFYLDEEEFEEEQQPRVHEQNSRVVHEPARKVPVRKQPLVADMQTSNSNVVSLQSIQKSSKVVLIEPRVYAEAQDISEHLKNRRAVVVNLQRIERDQGVRIVDFLSGTVYALGGDIQRIGTDIFLCVPENIEVDGNITDYFER